MTDHFRRPTRAAVTLGCLLLAALASGAGGDLAAAEHPPELERYEPHADRTPVILAPGLYQSPGIFRHGPKGGLAAYLDKKGFDVWLWTPWSRERPGIEELVDSASAVSEAVLATTGREPRWVGVDLTARIGLLAAANGAPISAVAGVGPWLEPEGCPHLLETLLAAPDSSPEVQTRLLTRLWSWEDVTGETLERVLTGDIAPPPRALLESLSRDCVAEPVFWTPDTAEAAAPRPQGLEPAAGTVADALPVAGTVAEAHPAAEASTVAPSAAGAPAEALPAAGAATGGPQSAGPQPPALAVPTPEPAGLEQLPVELPVLVISSPRDGLAIPEYLYPAYDKLPSRMKRIEVIGPPPNPGHLGLLQGRHAVSDVYRPLVRWLRRPSPDARAPLPVYPEMARTEAAPAAADGPGATHPPTSSPSLR